MSSLNIPKEIIEYLDTKIKEKFRGLHNALNVITKNYEAANTFLGDIFRVCEEYSKSRNKNQVAEARKLKQYLLHELRFYRLCAHCYNNEVCNGEENGMKLVCLDHFESHYFLYSNMELTTPFVREKICENRHMVVWAKTEGFHHYPAKVLGIEDSRVHVRFFGDFALDCVDASECRLYSKNLPGNPTITNQKLFESAVEVSTLLFFLLISVIVRSRSFSRIINMLEQIIFFRILQAFRITLLNFSLGSQRIYFLVDSWSNSLFR